MKHILEYLTERPWAITERAMDSITRFVHRESQDTDKVIRAFHGYLENPDGVKAVAARNGQYLANTGERAELRGRTAVLEVSGPLFRYANLFTAYSGATSVEMLAKDFNTAVNDPTVESILLNVNSPGGEADGISELAGMIYEARSKKPVWAYVGGWAASGGYWLASAADRLIMHRTGWGGSIGVIATINDDSKRRERDGYVRHEIVSSQSPLKRVDPETDEGAALLKGMVDSMAAHFIESVALYRNVTAEDVQSHFGRGFVIDAPRALQVGMADEMGTYEGTIAALNGGQSRANVVSIAAKAEVTTLEVQTMAEETQPVVAVNESEVRASAILAERARIAAILNCEEATGRRTLAEYLALKTEDSVEQARSILAASPKEGEAAKPGQDQLAAHMEKLGNPNVGVSAEPGDETAQLVASISQFIPAGQRRASK